MNNDHVKGKWNEVKGKVKEEVGHVTGNKSQAAEGVADQLKGKVQKGLGDAKDALKKGVDKVLHPDSN
jgi:uncharacterized protein YjbJ (UPF0337 family)